MGRGSVVRTVTSDTRGMSFESSLRQIFTTNILTVNYNKLARNGPFFKSLLETKATHFTFILSIFYLERYVCQRGQLATALLDQQLLQTAEIHGSNPIACLENKK